MIRIITVTLLTLSNTYAQAGFKSKDAYLCYGRQDHSLVTASEEIKWVFHQDIKRYTRDGETVDLELMRAYLMKIYDTLKVAPKIYKSLNYKVNKALYPLINKREIDLENFEEKMNAISGCLYKAAKYAEERYPRCVVRDLSSIIKTNLSPNAELCEELN